MDGTKGRTRLPQHNEDELKLKQKLNESDLYLPLKSFMQGQGYEVKSEVHNCDVVAIRGDEEVVVVELKLSINLTVVLQAVDRLALTPKVYIGIPEKCSSIKTRRKQIIKMLRMLGIGLMTINPERKVARVDILCDPGDYQPRKSKPRKERLLGEFARRVGDPNLGGSDTRKGRMTAYRQRALAIASYLQQHGPSKASDIATALSDAKARDIVYKDVYGWFERVAVGIYDVTPKGTSECRTWTLSDSDR